MMEFVNNGQGCLKSNLTGELKYESFAPTKLKDISCLELLEGNPIVDIGFIADQLGIARTEDSSR